MKKHAIYEIETGRIVQVIMTPYDATGFCAEGQSSVEVGEGVSGRTHVVDLTTLEIAEKQ